MGLQTCTLCTFKHANECHSSHGLGVDGRCHGNATVDLLCSGKLFDDVECELNGRGQTQGVANVVWT